MEQRWATLAVRAQRYGELDYSQYNYYERDEWLLKEYIILNSLNSDLIADIYKLLASILDGKDAQDAGLRYLDKVRPWAAHSREEQKKESFDELIKLYKQEVKRTHKDG